MSNCRWKLWSCSLFEKKNVGHGSHSQFLFGYFLIAKGILRSLPRLETEIRMWNSFRDAVDLRFPVNAIRHITQDS